MRTRKPLCPAEKVWVDKHRYDEAERLHYEREATLAASAAGPCQELVAVNGFCHDEPGEEELKAELCGGGAGSGRKHKKRKGPPRGGSLEPRVDVVLTGLLSDRVWFDKPLFDRAEAAYRKNLADALLQAVSQTPRAAERSALVPWSEVEPRGGVRPRRNLAVFQCSHGSLVACHHLIQDVWINKVNFDDAEKTFVERCEWAALPQVLQLPSTPWQGGKDHAEQQMPDEGYGTALPTPSTPAESTEAAVYTGAPFVSPDTPGDLNQTVNGKPPMAGLQALVSEVWLEKPIYDDAERSFYANMFDGHPPGKVRLQERGRPESLKRSRKDKKSRSAGKRGGSTAPIAPPQDVSCLPSAWYFMHKDSESLWLKKPVYDCAEAQYYAAEALKLASEQERARMSGTVSAKEPLPAARPSSAPESNAKKMATNFLAHEKIWFDKFKYDDAERRYYEQMNGPVCSPSCPQENGSSTILRDIARARENIQKSLAGLKTVLQNPQEAPPARRKKQSGRAASASATSPAGPSGDQNELVARIANLETENRNLRSVVTDLQLAISRLETRLSVLEKASVSHHPSQTPPTQHVTPMKKVEPLPALSRKVELPAGSLARQAESPAAEDEDDDDDIDLFGSDDEEEDLEAARVREERLRQYSEKKSKKPGLIAKSSILLDVKPWDDETDMAKMEECVRTIQMDGLVWGASKLVPVGYGIKKLQIQCVVEDDKVGTDILEEEITKFEDYVQSVDIAAFNKI